MCRSRHLANQVGQFCRALLVLKLAEDELVCRATHTPTRQPSSSPVLWPIIPSQWRPLYVPRRFFPRLSSTSAMCGTRISAFHRSERLNFLHYCAQVLTTSQTWTCLNQPVNDAQSLMSKVAHPWAVAPLKPTSNRMLACQLRPRFHNTIVCRQTSRLSAESFSIQINGNARNLFGQHMSL